MDYNIYSKNEQFLICIFREKLHLNSQYLSLPSEICFSFCVNETIHNLKLNIENSKINHLYLIKDFYDFVVKDSILKKIDESEYYNLLNYLQKALGGSISSKELLLFLTSIKALFQKKYLNEIYNEVLTSFNDENIDNDSLYFLYSTFLNEIIVNKCSYQCLIYLFNDFNKNNKFENLYKFLDYLWKNCDENIEILVPIKNWKSEDLKFLSTYNQIEEIGDLKYLKIYENNTIDYVFLFQKQKKRIDTYFNFIKFYGSSNIDYSFDQKSIIKRKVIDDSIDVPLREIISYNPFTGTKEMRENSITTMYSLYDAEAYNLYYSINDILSYAERDNDLLSSASFVDNWIAIESLIKLSGNKNGIEGVVYYLPKILAVEFLRKDLNTLLKVLYKEMTIERFIKLVIEDNLKMSYSRNAYLKWRLSKYIDILKNPKELDNELSRIEESIERDLRRIYIIRNEYVHSSNNDVWNNTSKLKIKHLLSFTLDCVMRTINNNVKSEHYLIDGEDIFSDILKNYNNRKNVLQALSGDFKINDKKISKNSVGQQLEKYKIMSNIILNKRNSLNIYYERNDSPEMNCKKREKCYG